MRDHVENSPTISEILEKCSAPGVDAMDVITQPMAMKLAPFQKELKR